MNNGPNPQELQNGSLDDAIELLQREVDRLKLSLDTYRQLEHPRRGEIIRWHVRNLDRRQDALEQLYAMLLAQRSSSQPVH